MVNERIAGLLSRSHGRDARVTMGRFGLLALLMASLGATTSVQPQPSSYSSRYASTQPTTRPLSFEDNYLLILQRNIFSRTRTYVYSGTSYTPTTQESYTPQQAYELTGVAEQQGNYVAFIENRRTNETLRYVVGDGVAGGTITKIGLDGIDFVMNGRPMRIEIGMSLSGLAPTTQSSLYAGSTTSPSGTSSGGSGDILERLRQRRLQELKK